MASGTLRKDSAAVLAGNIVTGLSSYGFTLVLVWLLPGRGFSEVASVSAMLLVAGTAAQAGIPWVVAREVVRRSADDLARRRAIGFALCVAIVSGIVAAAAIDAMAARYITSGVMVAVSVGAPAIFIAQVGAGYLQGERRFRAYALLMTVEAVLRLAVGAALAAAGGGPSGALCGSAAGACAGAAIAMWVIRRELAWPHQIAIDLWRQLGGLGAVQIAVALLSTMDVMVESVLHGSSRAFGGYQALLVFARVPLFISGALSAVVYPRLTRGDDAQTRSTVAMAVKWFIVASGTVLVLVSSVPRPVLGLVLPMGYVHEDGLLLPLAIAGVAYGYINLLTTLLQARSRFQSALRVLGPSVPAAGVVLGAATSSLQALAWSAALVDLVIAGALVLVTSRCYDRCGLVRSSVTGIVALGTGAAVFAQLRAGTIEWALAGAMLCVAVVVAPGWGLLAGARVGGACLRWARPRPVPR